MQLLKPRNYSFFVSNDFFELKLPQETYYVKELDAGTTHILSDTEYDFEFTVENTNATYPIQLYSDTVGYGNERMLKVAVTPF